VADSVAESGMDPGNVSAVSVARPADAGDQIRGVDVTPKIISDHQCVAFPYRRERLRKHPSRLSCDDEVQA
jgi:hypothetical protein